jgi:sugar phosphate isomerase/epimerase
MDVSMTTDYVTYLGDPEPYLRRIASAGFTHIHWCHQWNTGHIYSEGEIGQVEIRLKEFGLRLLDLHGPHGTGRGWGSTSEVERAAAVELIRNRIDMTARLSGRAVVIHLPPGHGRGEDFERAEAALHGSLDEIEAHAAGTGVRIALENMEDDSFEGIERLLLDYDRGFLGLCYDSGHGNIGSCGLDNLGRFRCRLTSIHLHDNDGRMDQHALPFTGTVDWVRLAKIIADSSYDGCVSLESNMRSQTIEERLYLRQAYEAASRVTQLIETERGLLRGSSRDVSSHK